VFGGDKVEGAYLLGINGTVWAITGLLAVFPLNWVSPRMGKRNTLAIAIILMCLAQLSKIVCYNPSYPYLIIIPTVLLSAGMLFFFTLGSSMVGDICDEDELKTGYRSEGSFYSIFWWFIKMGTALASFVGGALIVFTLFDEVQVTKVDKLQGSLRELSSTVSEWKGDTAAKPILLKEQIEKVSSSAGILSAHLQDEAGGKRKNKDHYDGLLQPMNEVNAAVSALNVSMTKEEMMNTLKIIDQKIVPLKRQSPYTLLMMRVVEIGLPVVLSIISMIFLLHYALTERRSHEIKDLLRQRSNGRKEDVVLTGDSSSV
jgi:GPH family glycoside/pentoside/hexuronide:cation symporter